MPGAVPRSRHDRGGGGGALAALAAGGHETFPTSDTGGRVPRDQLAGRLPPRSTARRRATGYHPSVAEHPGAHGRPNREEVAMHEVLPIAAGAALGAAGLRLVAAWLRLPLLIVASVAVGVVASWVSGELAVSWGFVSVDAALVLGTALLTVGLGHVWERRRAEARVKVE